MPHENVIRRRTAPRFGRVVWPLLLAWVVASAGALPADEAPGDLVIPRAEGKMSVKSMPASRFPHWIHRINYRCDACHMRLFAMETGATSITMSGMRKGETCGACHDGERAFAVSIESCNTCHAAPSSEENTSQNPSDD